VIRDKKLPEGYIKNWEEHERHLEVYIGRESRIPRLLPVIFPSLIPEMGVYYNHK
jgi:hypothetical protein